MSYIPSDIAAGFSNEYDQFFDYFSREFIVHKEPIQVINQVQNTTLYGYGESSDSINYSYIPVTGIYKGRIYYNNSRDVDSVNSELKLIFARGDVTLKVKQPARDFIAEGRTLKIEFDGKSWNVITEDIIKTYLDKKYYVYGLEQAK